MNLKKSTQIIIGLYMLIFMSSFGIAFKASNFDMGKNEPMILLTENDFNPNLQYEKLLVEDLKVNTYEATIEKKNSSPWAVDIMRY